MPVRALPNVANGNYERIPVTGCGMLATTSKIVIFVPKDCPGGIELFRAPFKADLTLRTFTFRLPPGELFTDVTSEYELVMGDGVAHDVSWQQVPESTVLTVADRTYQFGILGANYALVGSVTPYAPSSARFAITSLAVSWDLASTSAAVVELRSDVRVLERWYIATGTPPSERIAKVFAVPVICPAGELPSLVVFGGGGGLGATVSTALTLSGLVITA